MNLLLPLAIAPAWDGMAWESFNVIFLKLLVIGALVLLNAFFVAAEFSIVKVRSTQLQPLIAEGDRRAILAQSMVADLDAYLSACQLGVTLASLGLGWLGEPFLARMLEPFFRLAGISSPAILHTLCFGIAFSLITIAHIVVGELAPKTIAIRKALITTLIIARPLRLFHVAFGPAILFLNFIANVMLKRVFRLEPGSIHEAWHSEEELRAILTESERGDEVSPIGKEIVINALDFRKLHVRDITTPRGEVVALDVENSFEENLRIALECRHTRLPLCRGHLDETLGQIHIKDLLLLMREPSPDLTSVKREIFPVPEMMTLEKLLKFFLTKHAHLALVVDEFGGTVGIVTLDNVLAELVGEIQDEFDTEDTEFRKLNEDEFLVEGTLGLYELRDLVGLELESADVSTVGGYVTHLFGHLPQKGERIQVENFEITITQSDGRRVEQVHFKRLPAEASPEE